MYISAPFLPGSRVSSSWPGEQRDDQLPEITGTSKYEYHDGGLVHVVAVFCANAQGRNVIGIIYVTKGNILQSKVAWTVSSYTCTFSNPYYSQVGKHPGSCHPCQEQPRSRWSRRSRPLRTLSSTSRGPRRDVGKPPASGFVQRRYAILIQIEGGSRFVY